MISKRRTLILGAGASMPYGFPSGEKLYGLIIESLVSELKQNGIYVLTGEHPKTYEKNKDFEYYLKCGYSKVQLENFRYSLELSGLGSIDAFLEHQPDFIPLGKLAIANILLKYEVKASFQMADRHWYKYLWQKLLCKVDEFDGNQLSVITYNYDRSLEYYLLDCIKATYGINDQRTLELLNAIKIVHLHGQLGDIIQNNDNYIPFGANGNKEYVSKASEGIKIIHENMDDTPEYKKAKTLLWESERIYILGFGYHETNLRRLNLEHVTQNDIIGSALGFTDREILSIESKTRNRLKLQKKGENLMFLREFADLS